MNTLTTADVEALQAALDLTPADATLRLILADALEDSGVPDLAVLADGYRTLARWGRSPYMHYDSRYTHLNTDGFPGFAVDRPACHCALPYDWWKAAAEAERMGNWLTSRRAADDWAARGFSSLPPARRAELLAGPVHPPESGA